MHGVAPRADATRNSAVTATDKPQQNSRSQPHGLKETASVDQRPVLQEGPQAVLQSQICLERPNALERKTTVTPITHCGENPEQVLHDHRLHCIKRGEMKVERSLGLFDDASKSAGGFVQSAGRSQLDAPYAIRPMSSSSHDHTALNSGIHPNAKSPSDSTRCENDITSSQGLAEDDLAPNCSRHNGQFDTFSKNAVDLKASDFRMSENCKRQRKSLVEQCSPKNLQSHAKKQWEGNNLRTHSGKVEIGGPVDLFFAGGDRWPYSEKRLKSVNDNYVSVQVANSNQILNLDKATTRNARQKGSSAGTSNKETKHFTGPKSLAQIKAEKTAQRKSPVETVERCNLINTIIDAGKTAAAARKKSRPAESAQIAGKSPMSTVAYNELVEDKQRTAFLVEFEGPKPLSLLLKRKRELQSRSSGLETSSAPEAEAAIADSSLDLEDGKVGGDFKDLNEGTTSSLNSVLVHGDLQPICPRPKHTAEVEATNINVDFPEGLDFDTEMEDVASMDAVSDGSFAFGMDDEDDDEEDFAKKLGRIFSLSSD